MFRAPEYLKACQTFDGIFGVEGRERRKVPAEWLEDEKTLVIHVSEEG